MQIRTPSRRQQAEARVGVRLVSLRAVVDRAPLFEQKWALGAAAGPIRCRLNGSETRRVRLHLPIGSLATPPIDTIKRPHQAREYPGVGAASHRCLEGARSPQVEMDSQSISIALVAVAGSSGRPRVLPFLYGSERKGEGKQLVEGSLTSGPRYPPRPRGRTLIPVFTSHPSSRLDESSPGCRRDSRACARR